jgi:hypothetical protein
MISGGFQPAALTRRSNPPAGESATSSLQLRPGIERMIPGRADLGVRVREDFGPL